MSEKYALLINRADALCHIPPGMQATPFLAYFYYNGLSKKRQPALPDPGDYCFILRQISRGGSKGRGVGSPPECPFPFPWHKKTAKMCRICSHAFDLPASPAAGIH